MWNVFTTKTRQHFFNLIPYFDIQIVYKHHKRRLSTSIWGIQRKISRSTFSTLFAGELSSRTGRFFRTGAQTQFDFSINTKFVLQIVFLNLTCCVIATPVCTVYKLQKCFIDLSLSESVYYWIGTRFPSKIIQGEWLPIHRNYIKITFAFALLP